MTMGKHLPVLSLAAWLAVGCAAAPSSKDSWAYAGPDAVLNSPFMASRERQREMVEELGGKPGTPSEALQQKVRDEFEAWKKVRLDAVQTAKDVCARETGDSATPGFLGRYGEAFLACMKTRGWSRSSYGDPLRSAAAPIGWCPHGRTFHP